MKKLPDKAEIAESIITELKRGPLRKDRSNAQACAVIKMAVERMIETLRVGYRGPRPDVGSTRKSAKNFRKALDPLSDAMPIFIKGCDRPVMTLRELRSALDWFESSEDGPSPKFEGGKHCAAIYARRLVNEFSQKPPSTAIGGQVREIGTLLYQAFSGEEDVKLKRQTDAVCRNRRYDNEIPERPRRIVIKDGKVHEPYLDECRADPRRQGGMIARRWGR